ncbi:MarR family transcriptional regulator [Streptomyces sp. SID13666]|uniref:MarR family winged helix-turn-helix transcriptional regulator n=1 Tax=Streptomyces TaxID=1883 RepID=UPI0011061AF3|nr:MULTISPECIES: MarR family transcriptional regulator [Streptomyces]MCZ4096736.1 MarR family transcriptional regulator [Streptomyces sp. H39-C1]NEA56115.1 MarR family transcriptional regulator [Streptomyces sp. SID13666]NEA71786.1 MarR family transcriptional regulator [Streptomyces sp. SID13588]QNA77162.1 MarR family transcriptional regulator [Streptomyces sp. So13.3]
MPRADINLGDLAARDHAFYGLVWAGTTLTARVDRALVRAHDLPLSWFEVMLWLHGQSEPVAASDLGAKTLLSRSQVSRVADALQARGLIERSTAPSDARSVRITLTPAGREAFAAADATRRQALAEVFNDLLDDDDIQSLETVWQKLKQHRDD